MNQVLTVVLVALTFAIACAGVALTPLTTGAALFLIAFLIAFLIVSLVPPLVVMIPRVREKRSSQVLQAHLLITAVIGVGGQVVTFALNGAAWYWPVGVAAAGLAAALAARRESVARIRSVLTDAEINEVLKGLANRHRESLQPPEAQTLAAFGSQGAVIAIF